MLNNLIFNKAMLYDVLVIFKLPMIDYKCYITNTFMMAFKYLKPNFEALSL